MWGRVIFAALALASVASNATALDANMGTVSVALPPPQGFCELSTSDPSDQRLLTTQADKLTKAGNTLLAMSADCQQLADWHSHAREFLDDYAQYQTSNATLDKPPMESVAQTCTTLRAHGQIIASQKFADYKARIESAVDKVKINQSSFLGVLAEDREACYAGLIQKITTEANTEKTILTVMAILIVRDRAIYAYRYATYEDADTVSAKLAKLKIDVAALIAANPGK